jgi:hypothetical protein
MRIGSWWAITAGTQTGPWHVTSKGKAWYIVNMLTLTTKKIGGPSIGRGLNYFDRAIEIARKRNAKFLKEHREELPLYLGRYPEFDKTITEVLKGA